METVLYLVYQAAGLAPMIPLDDKLRPTWLFGKTVHEGCDRAGYYEQADFANEYGSPKCLVKIGCWGPVVNCNVTKRGWMAGIGGCPNVGGICIACTMPGFPDKFMPFMDQPPGAKVSSDTALAYGSVIRALRHFTHDPVEGHLLPVALQFQDSQCRGVRAVVKCVRLLQAIHVTAGHFGFRFVLQTLDFRKYGALFSSIWAFAKSASACFR